MCGSLWGAPAVHTTGSFWTACRTSDRLRLKHFSGWVSRKLSQSTATPSALSTAVTCHTLKVEISLQLNTHMCRGDDRWWRWWRWRGRSKKVISRVIIWGIKEKVILNKRLSLMWRGFCYTWSLSSSLVLFFPFLVYFVHFVFPYLFFFTLISSLLFSLY